MISWMQRHRKYLVITIWISTIAFIGAGFVGWGQFKYGDKASAIGKVGDVEISLQELQESYSRLFLQYQQIFQGKFDEEQAKSLGLQQQALEQLINTSLIKNLALQFELQVSDEEVANQLIANPSFQKDGHFSATVYNDLLAQNGIRKSNYEKQLRDSLLLQKLLKIIAPKEATALEQESLSITGRISDTITYDILSSDDIHIETNESVLTAYWKAHQNEYLSEPSYQFEIATVPITSVLASTQELEEFYALHKDELLDENGAYLDFNDSIETIKNAYAENLAHRDAKRLYSKFKKGEYNGTTTRSTITTSHSPYPTAVTQELIALENDGDLLKPRRIDNAFLIFKRVTSIPAQPLAFSTVRDAVLQAYTNESKRIKLQELANTLQNTFKGSYSATLTQNSLEPLAKISSYEQASFIKSLFSQSKKRGIIQLSEDKIVLYKILAQKMLPYNKSEKIDSAMKYKAYLFNGALVNTLKQKYSVEIYIQGK